MKKRLLALLLTGAVLTSLAACGGGNDSSNGGDDQSASQGSSDGTFTASGETLNVGVQSNIISIPTVYAEEQGYFDELGLDVNLIMFPNGSPENEGAVHRELMNNGIALLEGIDLSGVPAGDYFLFAAPLNIACAEAAPCRALLIEGITARESE